MWGKQLLTMFKRDPDISDDDEEKRQKTREEIDKEYLRRLSTPRKDYVAIYEEILSGKKSSASSSPTQSNDHPNESSSPGDYLLTVDKDIPRFKVRRRSNPDIRSTEYRYNVTFDNNPRKIGPDVEQQGRRASDSSISRYNSSEENHQEPDTNSKNGIWKALKNLCNWRRLDCRFWRNYSIECILLTITIILVAIFIIIFVGMIVYFRMTRYD